MRPASFGVFAVALLCAACSAVVDPDDVPLRCAVTAEAPNPCPIGMRCDDGVCRTAGVDGGGGGGPDGCVPSEELCDGVDNDCDGEVNEGHDVDEDGFTWCGNGTLSLADCEDREPTAYPGGTEVCDGIDNDCDATVDEGSLCPPEQTCSERVCVDANDCTRPENECPSGQVCNTSLSPPRCEEGTDCRVTGSCAEGVCDTTTGNCVTPQPLGSPCASDTECAEGYCALLTVTGTSASPESRMCVRACCNDTQCSAGTICWAAPTGAKLCIPPEAVERQRGTGGALTSCGVDGECASGVCASDLGGCMGNCSSDAQCAGATCALYRRDGSVLVNACRTDTRGGDVGDSCADGSDCRYGLCYRTFWSGYCGGPCGTTADCPDGWSCSWRELETGQFVQLCLPGIGMGRGPGEACTYNSECHDYACVGGQCWQTCCSDSDCGTGEGRCRAVRFAEGRYEMHCVP